MDLTVLVACLLAAVAAGGVAWVFLYPILSGGARAEKRQKALVAAGPNRRVDRTALSATARRDQVAQSLKDLEKRQKDLHKITLEMRIAQAGFAWSKGRFWMTSLIVGLLLAVVLQMLSDNIVMALAGLFVGGLGMPRWFLNFRKKRRLNRFLDELPNAMDVIVRGIRSGLPIGDCLRIIANEAQEPVRSEFRYLVEQQALGLSIADASVKMYERVPVPEANFFAIVIGIQQKSGGNLAETIGNLSRVLRDRKKMKGKIQAMSMEAKASAGIIAALPFAVGLLTYLSSPDYVSLLWTTLVGKVMLCFSAFWMFLGVSVMRKMINFDF